MYSSTLANINDTSARAANCGGVAKNWIILIKRHTFDSFHLFENYILIDSQLPARVLRITWLWLDVFLVFHKLINLFDSNDCYKDRRTICSCTRKGFLSRKEYGIHSLHNIYLQRVVYLILAGHWEIDNVTLTAVTWLLKPKFSYKIICDF